MLYHIGDANPGLPITESKKKKRWWCYIWKRMKREREEINHELLNNWIGRKTINKKRK